MATTTATTTSATAGPLATRATRTATPPIRAAPTMGMKPPRKISTDRGRARGTRSTSRVTPMTTASSRATTAVPRT